MPDVAPLLARPVPNDASGSAIERCIEGGHLVQQGERAQLRLSKFRFLQFNFLLLLNVLLDFVCMLNSCLVHQLQLLFDLFCPSTGLVAVVRIPD